MASCGDTRCNRGGKWLHEYIVADIHEFGGIDFRETTDPKKMHKIREQIVQEVRLPEGEITFPFKDNYKRANATVPLQPLPDAGQPLGNSDVEPLMLGNAVADEEAPAPNPNVKIADIFNDAPQVEQLDSGV